LTYQKKDNATQAVLDLATYAYNLSNKGPQLVGITHTNGEPALGFTYDNNGNTATQVVNSATPVTTTYAWDQDDKMTGLTTSDSSQSAAYTYAYNGDRLQRTLNGTAWNYLYSKEDILKVDEGGTNPMYLTQGPGIDDVLAETAGASRNYAYKNMLSSVLQLAGPTGLVASNYNYDAWGQATNWPNPTVDQNPYGYTGREWDGAGTYYYRARFYGADTSRFTQRDPLGKKGDPNPYAYALGNPIMKSDPNGLDTVGCDMLPRQLQLTSRCLLQCCAAHDECYDHSHCSYNSWVSPLSEYHPLANRGTHYQYPRLFAPQAFTPGVPPGGGDPSRGVLRKGCLRMTLRVTSSPDYAGGVREQGRRINYE
jgi:RHS repeat-associated protein